MKTFTKIALGAAMLAGAAITATAPAEARVGVVLNLGIPAPVVVAPVRPDCYGPRYYDACAYPVYSERVFWNGAWFDHAPYRMIGGRREFWVHGGWHPARVGGRGFHR
jgi:hypothetical protein